MVVAWTRHNGGDGKWSDSGHVGMAQLTRSAAGAEVVGQRRKRTAKKDSEFGA